MLRKLFIPEMIIAKLRLIEVALANGHHLGEALKQDEISAPKGVDPFY